MKRWLVAVMALGILLAQSTAALAENQTWVDKKYDFSAVKSVYLAEPTFAETVDKPEQITQLQMRDEYLARAKQVKKVQVLDDSNIKSLLLRYMVIDYDALAAKDSEGAAASFNKGIAAFAELKVQPVVQIYNISKEWHDPYTYTTTEYEDIKFRKDGKETTISVPRTEEHYVAGHYTYTQNIKVAFNVYSTKDDTLVFSYVDSRAADKAGIDMYKRMVDGFYGKFKKVF